MKKISIIGILFFVINWLGQGYPLYPGINETNTSGTLDLLRVILQRADTQKTPAAGDLQKYLAISAKFSQRPRLLTGEVLTAMYNNYDAYNSLVDFVEKIPVQEPATVIKLFAWVKNFERLDNKNKPLLTAVFQSLLELFSQAAKYAPDHYDYDALINKMMALPWTPNDFYDKLFGFFETELDIRLNKKNFIDFVLEGIDNRDLEINNTVYKFLIKDKYRKAIEEMLQSQGVASTATLLRINRLLDQSVEKQRADSPIETGNRILQAFEELPYAGISEDAPRAIRDRVLAYSKKKLNLDVTALVKKINSHAPIPELASLILEIKNNYLVYHLKDHLVALVYAVNAKNPKLRVFLNPNLARLHDFDDHKTWTPWNYCGPPPVPDAFSAYHFSGGLSRLNIAFAAKWYELLFRRTLSYNPAQLQGLLINLLDLYPVPAGGRAAQWDDYVQYTAVLEDFGLELLRKARENEAVGKDVLKELKMLSSGYHYRETAGYITGKTKEFRLFFSEIRLLGEVFSKKKEYLEASGYKELLKKIPPRAGAIYYHTFGNLTPQPFRLFPQGLANLFESGWTNGEIIDEFKVRLAWFLYKKKIPAYFMGQLLYSYLTKTAPRVYNQNNPNDYFSSYFMFKVFNNSHLNGAIKDLQKEGYLKLK